MVQPTQPSLMENLPGIRTPPHAVAGNPPPRSPELGNLRWMDEEGSSRVVIINMNREYLRRLQAIWIDREIISCRLNMEKWGRNPRLWELLSFPSLTDYERTRGCDILIICRGECPDAIWWAFAICAVEEIAQVDTILVFEGTYSESVQY
jgi:hypothetical protein